MWLKRFLIVALVTITFDVTASITLDTRVDLDFSKLGRTSVVYDNVGEQIAMEFDEFDPQTIYMNVRNSLDRSQLLDGIRFSITDNLVIRSMRQFGGRDGEKGVEVQVKYFNDRPGRWDVIFDTRNPLSTGTAFANHSGGTEFTVELRFGEPTTSAELRDAMFFDDYVDAGWSDRELTLNANIIDYSFKTDDVDNLNKGDGGVPAGGNYFYGLTGDPIPEPSCLLLGAIALLPLMRRTR